jgi:hypothetical protein
LRTCYTGKMTTNRAKRNQRLAIWQCRKHPLIRKDDFLWSTDLSKRMS